jgi:hypothetical protein
LSKNHKVLHSAFKICKELGDLEDKAALFVESTASQGLIKLYKQTDDNSLRQETLSLLKSKVIIGLKQLLQNLAICEEESRVA